MIFGEFCVLTIELAAIIVVKRLGDKNHLKTMTWLRIWLANRNRSNIACCFVVWYYFTFMFWCLTIIWFEKCDLIFICTEMRHPHDAHWNCVLFTIIFTHQTKHCPFCTSKNCHDAAVTQSMQWKCNSGVFVLLTSHWIALIRLFLI